MRIEIAGALATGKSTLAALLRDTGIQTVHEDLSTNPYLDLRVEDPEKYDYLCQQQFVDDKIASIRNAMAAYGSFVADYSLAAERAYVSFYCAHRPDWVDLLVGRLDAAEEALGLPQTIVHLECAPEVQLERIRARGRDFEQGHDVAFVADINARVAARVDDARRAGVRVFTYRSDLSPWKDIVSGLEMWLGENAATRAG